MSPFLAGVTWLLLFQCAGEALSRLLSLPVPGPVLGMLLLFVALRLRDQGSEPIATAADALAKHLSLLFVPAGVGVMMYYGRLAGEWLPIATALSAALDHRAEHITPRAAAFLLGRSHGIRFRRTSLDFHPARSPNTCA